MAKYTGYVHLKDLEFEVRDGASDLEVEEAFNDAVDVRVRSGFTFSDDYGYERVEDDEDPEGEGEDE